MKKHLSLLLVITLARGTLTVGDGSSSDEDNAQLRNPGRDAHPRPWSIRNQNRNVALGEGPSGVQGRPSQTRDVA